MVEKSLFLEIIIGFDGSKYYILCFKLWLKPIAISYFMNETDPVPIETEKIFSSDEKKN